MLFTLTEIPVRRIRDMPLRHTLLDSNVKKESLRIAAGLTTNRMASMGKNKGIRMETPAKICDAFQCGTTAVFGLADELLSKHKFQSLTGKSNERIPYGK